MIYPPRLNLATLPTPLVKLSRFSERLGGVNLWIKRDEMTGVEVSGNKIRKLEFALPKRSAKAATRSLPVAEFSQTIVGLLPLWARGLG